MQAEIILNHSWTGSKEASVCNPLFITLTSTISTLTIFILIIISEEIIGNILLFFIEITRCRCFLKYKRWTFTFVDMQTTSKESLEIDYIILMELDLSDFAKV